MKINTIHKLLVMIAVYISEGLGITCPTIDIFRDGEGMAAVYIPDHNVIGVEVCNGSPETALDAIYFLLRALRHVWQVETGFTAKYYSVTSYDTEIFAQSFMDYLKNGGDPIEYEALIDMNMPLHNLDILRKAVSPIIRCIHA